MEKNSIIQHLLKAVHYYYPIGMPNLYKEYDGYAILKKILEDKINGVESSISTPWDLLVKNIKESTKYFQIFNFGYLQFPSYILNVELSNKVHEEIEVMENILLCISLLVPYYTIYIVSQYKFGDYEIAGKKKKHISLTFSSKNFDNKYADLVSMIKQNVDIHFVGHKFIDHKILFNYKLFGCYPYGLGLESSRKEFTFYDYLFSSDFAGFEYSTY